MHGVAERIEDGAEVGVDRVVVHPHVAGGEGEVLGERAVPLHAETDRPDAHLAAARAAVAARAAHDVPLARDAVADRDVLDERPDLDDLTVELVPGDERCDDGARGPLVPLADVQVGAADAGPQHANHHVGRSADRVGSVDELEPGPASAAPGTVRTTVSFCTDL